MREQCLRCIHRRVCERWKIVKELWNMEEYQEYDQEVARKLKFRLLGLMNILVPSELVDKLDVDALRCAEFRQE